MKKRLLIIGPLPDPKGGVGVHIKRLGELISPYFELKYIDESSYRKSEYFNLRSYNMLTYIKLLKWADVIHVHSGLHTLRIFHLIISKIFFKKVIITYHNTPKKKNLFFIRLYLNFYNKVIFVNKETAFKLLLNTTTYIQEAFIPQNISNESALPINIESWIIDKKAQGYVLLAANAWRLDVWDNTDLYGLDMCIELINEFKRTTNKKVAFVFNVSSVPKRNGYFQKYTEQIKELTLENEFLLTNQNVSFVKVIEQSDLVLRPTNTDGDALTIRESLYMGVPVIASDVVVRPESTIIFKCRNQNDLFNKVNSTLENIDKVRESVNKKISNDYLTFYRHLYDF
jgi:glycosyltransferase involved in cell wall biosynthesis